MNKILIVDASQKGRMILGSILTSKGYDVFLAWNTEEAVNVFRKEEDRIPLIFFDIDGKTGNPELFLAEIFRISTKRVPVIGCSSRGEFTLEEKARLTKAAGIVDRPYIPELITTIAKTFYYASF